MTISDTITGAGLRFPLRPDARGALTMAAGTDNIEQSLGLILLTNRHERVMRPNFGSRLRELLFSAGSEQSLRLIEDSARETIRDWEPRIDVLALTATADARAPNHVLLAIDYRVRATYVRGNLVFPLYLEGRGDL